jgi:hypothetical protein
MARAAGVNHGGVAYHVLNRSHARLPFFESDADYELLVRVLGEAHDRVAMPLVGKGKQRFRTPLTFL